MIPEKWDIKTLNSLVDLKDIESEEFDFKGPEYSELDNHICAMANTSGGHLVLGVVEVKNEKTNDFIRFEKKGFDEGKERDVEIRINNATMNIEPYPKLCVKNVVDENEKKFYPVIKIENINYQKPYFVKGSGRCYIRASASSVPASRSVVINLLSDHIQKKNSVLKLRAACKDIIEQLHYTIRDIQIANPKEGASIIKPLNLNFLQNSVLDTEWLFLKNNLYGGHINENSNVEGYYSFYNKLERLNLAINLFNQPINPFSIQFFLDQRETIKNNEMKFWHLSGNYTKEVISFLERIITLCNEFENYK